MAPVDKEAASHNQNALCLHRRPIFLLLKMHHTHPKGKAGKGSKCLGHGVRGQAAQV